ncbi:unnamed protein product [Ceutorhynchus assimilis]|uniref:Kinesin motor domain-containing protein n=1 Tax=Ceutorhynchus assimilis TaxID=467358 RepID=A0A9P0GQ90_9CUCU|nr:unnamed protein product [Ceutorhynchus assimilis]
MDSKVDSTAVKVAVRVRPLVQTEIARGCQEIVEVIPENEQVVLKSLDKAFTFNYVLGSNTEQDELYNRCVAPLLKSLFEGFNVTIFAYGQTGSGKTHSMGTAYCEGENVGVIPRAVHEIFSTVKDQFSFDFTITVSFVELYREILYDLMSEKSKEQCILEIREDLTKGIHIPNLTEIPVESAQQILDVLIKGSRGRATASTNMNATSSRSHSIFTVNLAMQHKVEKHQNRTAKLHLVDLAGSERPKKTGASGTTFKEGVDINKGLFVLGKVISALGDEKSQNNFVPYRDSNLTRLLKDSLGGNSVTLMIACISPADYNLEETLSTLRYADRARKIKNKPIVNQDPKTAQINDLKKQIKLLQLQIVGQGGPMITASEIDHLKASNQELKAQLSAALLDKTGLHEKVHILQTANEVRDEKVSKLKDDFNIACTQINLGLENQDLEIVKENVAKLTEIQQNFNNLHSDQLKTQDAIRNHEETFEILVQSATKTSHMPIDVQEKEESHRTVQLDLNSQLQEVFKQLALKEQLARQLQANTQYMVDEQGMLETARKIENLEKEKHELLQQLKNVKCQENSQKVSEKRRKRVQELEEQLKDLKKKVTEQSRLIRLKEKDEQKIRQLNHEIVSIKTAKVKLFKQMREEADKFRTLKQDSERKLARVKQQDNKNKTEMAKMKVAHEKQKNVLKRKFEEAAALSKRLQNMLLKRNHVQENKFSNKYEKVANWLREELEVHVNLAEAQFTLDELLEDRATLQKQMDDLKANPETENGLEVKSIESDLELRSLQIQELQQKLLDSDEGSKSKVRFDVVQTMIEAKYALRSIFEQAAENGKIMVQVRRAMTELQESYKEVMEKNSQLEANFAEQMANTEREYQEKVGVLLKQMRGIKNKDVSPESEVLYRCEIQDEKIVDQESTIQQQQQKIEELQEKLKAIQDTAAQQLDNSNKRIRRDQTFTAPDDVDLVEKTPQHIEYRRPQKFKLKKSSVVVDFADLSDEDIENNIADDVKNDPDWRNTPLESDSLAGSKRSSNGGCTCRGNCKSSKCGCKKLQKSCTSSCRCKETCENQQISHSEVTSTVNQINPNESDEQDDQFKKQRLDEHVSDTEKLPAPTIIPTKLKKSRFIVKNN